MSKNKHQNLEMSDEARTALTTLGMVASSTNPNYWSLRKGIAQQVGINRFTVELLDNGQLQGGVCLDQRADYGAATDFVDTVEEVLASMYQALEEEEKSLYWQIEERKDALRIAQNFRAFIRKHKSA